MGSISVAEALSELKLLKKRISKKLTALEPLALVKVSANDVDHRSIEKFAQEQRDEFKSMMSLIERYHKLKTGILRSNANTEVTVLGKKMTVTEAMTLKESLEEKNEVLNKLSGEYANVTDNLEREKRVLDEKFERHLKDLYGSEKKESLTPELYEDNHKAFYNKNASKLIDPLGAKEVIKQLSEEIDEYENKINFVLNSSNIVTQIEV